MHYYYPIQISGFWDQLGRNRNRIVNNSRISGTSLFYFLFYHSLLMLQCCNAVSWKTRWTFVLWKPVSTLPKVFFVAQYFWCCSGHASSEYFSLFLAYWHIFIDMLETGISGRLNKTRKWWWWLLLASSFFSVMFDTIQSKLVSK